MKRIRQGKCREEYIFCVTHSLSYANPSPLPSFFYLTW